jgi:hypothetical protein
VIELKKPIEFSVILTDESGDFRCDGVLLLDPDLTLDEYCTTLLVEEHGEVNGIVDLKLEKRR